MKKNKVLQVLFFLAILLISVRNIAQKTSTQEVFGTWGHGQNISNEIIKGLPFIRGWNFTFPWKEIEPEKGKFNWELFDSQLKIASDNDLYIGFMIWVGQFSPEWVYTKDGVPKVEVIDNIHETPYYPYYFSEAYKTDYRNLLNAVFEHIKKEPEVVRNKILFWMSAEGSTGDEGPYKGPAKDPAYKIDMKDWFEFKKDVWSFMYNEGNKMTPKLHVLINQANNGMYLDWLLQNTPETWFKAGSLAHTYSFNRELDYYNRLKMIVRPDNNGMTNRFRSESEEIQQLGWFKQSPQQNSFALVASSLCIGLDMMNVRLNAVREAEGDYSFLFFNRYAGQRDPATATGAFCVLRDALDATDTDRFPENEFGAVSGGDTKPGKNVAADQIRLLRNVNPERIENIRKKFAAQGAQSGPTPVIEAEIYRNDNKLPAKLRKNNLRPDLQDKYNNDIGIYLLPNNYNRFIEQYDPNGTSKGFWRVGPVSQPYGRYARGFEHENGMNEMWFSLNKNFFADNNRPHKVKITIAYLDKGNGKWSLNYVSNNGKVEKYQIQCSNKNKWITKEIEIDDLYTNKKMEHQTDFSLKYLSGDNTLFSLIELTRR
jgi:hypothetical protein